MWDLKFLWASEMWYLIVGYIDTTILEGPAASIFRLEKIPWMEASSYLELLVPIYQTTWHHNPEDYNLDKEYLL
jgi:hypothetical protein